jgi:hypothetical protein
MAAQLIAAHKCSDGVLPTRPIHKQTLDGRVCRPIPIPIPDRIPRIEPHCGLIRSSATSTLYHSAAMIRTVASCRFAILRVGLSTRSGPA